MNTLTEPETKALIRDLRDELSECLRVHAEYSNRMEAEVKKWKLATCKWQDMHSDVEAENKQLKEGLQNMLHEEWPGKRQCQYGACPEYARLKEAMVRIHDMSVRPRCTCGIPTGTAAIRACAAKALEETK